MCCSACRLDADKHASPLILLDLGGSKLDADQQLRRGNGGGTHGRGGWLQHGKPRRWRGTRQPTTREGRVGLFGVAERPVLLTRLGNAGGGKGPQVRSDDRRAAGLGSGDAYNPELRPGSPEASHAQAKEPSLTKGASHARNARGCRGVNRLDDPPEAMGKGGREPCRPRSQHRE